jgi:Vitamin B12 dependent methionine synthase, activation domain.
MLLTIEKLDEREILRYLGCKKAPSDALSLLVTECIKETLLVITPQYLFKRFEVKKSDAGLSLLGTKTVLPGNDIKDFVGNSTAIYLLCITLGIGIEKEIRRKMQISPDLAVVIDACATAAVEETADIAQALIKTECETRGTIITERFSPGYGDLPLNLQKELLFLVDAPRKIGLMVSDSLLLTPQKSITAVIGEYRR